jgi:hypothetical protein
MARVAHAVSGTIFRVRMNREKEKGERRREK